MIQQARRDGMFVVLSPEFDLPERCIKCNAECRAFRSRCRISTLSPWYSLFSSAGWNAHCADDRPIHIHFSLCLRHRFECFSCMALIAVSTLGNLICLIMIMAYPWLSPTIDLLAIVLPLPILAAALTIRPILRPRLVYQGLAWFTGAGPEFLESLPDLNAEPDTAVMSVAA